VDPVVECAQDLLDRVVSGLHEMQMDKAAPDNSFIRTVVLHPELYNSDEEASAHDLSTKSGVVSSIMRISR